MTNQPEETRGSQGDHSHRHFHRCDDRSLCKCGDACCIKKESQPSMQGGQQCRRKCDAPSSLWKTLPQSVNKEWTAHRTMEMQHKAQSLQQDQHTTAWCPRYNYNEETNNTHKMETTFYVADTPGPAILGLPSCSRLQIVHLNCSVQFRKHGKPIKSCQEREKVKQDQPINTREDLIKVYPDSFEGIRKFPGTYHIYLKEDDIPVVHAPRKCPIAIRPLVDKKLDKLLEQEVIIPVTEPTDWVSSFAYSWKADGDFRTCLNPTHLNKAIRWDHYRTPTLKEITHVGW